MRLLHLVIFAMIGLAPAAAFAEHGQIALTFDDLPSLTLLKSQAYVDYNNDMILHELKKHHFPAIGFVNEGKFNDLDRTRQIANVRKWRDAGMLLGNHTYSHESPNGIRASAYIADIARGEPVTRALLAERHRTSVWFRHPYLETGMPQEDKLLIDEWLLAHAYNIAPVTMENSDWLFAEPYDDAIARHDEPRVKRIKAQYIAYTEEMVDWYQKASLALFGRRIAFVMLLHVTRLNADSMEDLAKILARNDLRPVGIDTAMKDPAYRTHDPYVGPDGVEWLERWSLELNKSLPWDSFQDPPADVEAEYKKIDNDH